MNKLKSINTSKYKLKIRGIGLLIAIEILDKNNNANFKKTNSIVENGLKSGIIILRTGFPLGNVLALSPPITISISQIKYFVDFLIKELEI